MAHNNAGTSNRAIHNTSPPPSYTVAVDEVPLHHVSKNNVSESKHGRNVTLHLLYNSAPAEKTPDPANHVDREETLPLTATTTSRDGTGNNRPHVVPTAPLMEIKPIPEGPPPPYNPYYMPRGGNVTIPKPASQPKTKYVTPDHQLPRNRRTLSTSAANTSNRGKCIWPYWLLLIIPLIAVGVICIYVKAYMTVNEDKAPIREGLMEQWKNGRVFSLLDETDRRDVAIMLNIPEEKAKSREVVQWILEHRSRRWPSE